MTAKQKDLIKILAFLIVSIITAMITSKSFDKEEK